MEDRLKVAHLVMSLDCGGLERIVLDLVREGRNRGQSVSVVCLERPGTLAPTAESLGANLHCVHKRPGIRPSTFGRLKAVLRDIQPDVVHSHTIGALFYAGPATRSLRVPVVVHTEHVNNLRMPSHRLARWRKPWLWWWASRYCRRFFCVSQVIADELAERRIVPRAKLSVVLNGIDTNYVASDSEAAELRQSLGIPADSPVVGCVARLHPIKCPDLLIRGFAHLKARFPLAHLVLVGDGPMRAELHQLADRLRLNGSVHLVGYQPEPQRYLKIMNVFALTSALEGLPLVLLEAGAAGLPVVATAVGGVPELIRNGENGLLFPAGDENALQSLLGELLDDPGRAHRIGEAARREVVERYDLQRMASNYEQHYRDLLRAFARNEDNIG
jgi:glycosyltransferase involved in cell wall biosynthesis